MRKNLPVTDHEQAVGANANILSTTDTKGRIRYINKDFIDISGFNEDELLGQPHNMIRHPDMPPQAFQMLWDNLKSGQSWKGIVKNRCKNGDHYWVDAFATPIMKDGQAVEYQSVRVKAKPEAVARAKKLYQQLNAGKTPRFLKRTPISLQVKLAVAVAASILFGTTISYLLLADSLIAASLISVTLAIASTFILLKPLALVVDKAKKVTHDPVAMHVYTGRNDEAGQLMLAIKSLESETGGVVGRIDDDAKNLVNSNKSLIDSIQSNNKALEELYKENNAVAAAINEMSASIQEVALNTTTTSDAANSANSEATQSQQIVDITRQSIEALASEINSASEVIKQLEQDSESINTVVNVVRSVAEKTNLLALNAAIEAARAGEQGRGFAVVADEVRTLANRTHQSTEEITTMIEQLQHGSKNAVKKMNYAQEKASSSVDEAKKAALSINAISDAMEKIDEMSAQVATAIKEQSAVAEEINKNINQVMAYTDQISDGGETSEQASSNVQSLSERLSVLASQFWDKKQSKSS